MYDGDDLRKAYKKIKIYTTVDDLYINDENANFPIKESDNGSNYTQSVSFDTVPKLLGYAPGDASNGIDAANELEFSCLNSENASTGGNSYFDYSLSKDRSKSPPPKNGLQRLNSGGSLGMLGVTKKKGLDDIFKVGRHGKLVRIDYPSRPGVENYAMIINKYQKDWSRLWNIRKKSIENRYFNKDKFFAKPQIVFGSEDYNAGKKTASRDHMYDDSLTKRQKKLKTVLIKEKNDPYNKLSMHPRAFLVHISGRKHTWVALDYAIKNFVNNTDHLVVLANLPNIRNKARHNYNEILNDYAISTQTPITIPTITIDSDYDEGVEEKGDDEVINYFKENKHFTDDNFDFRSRSRSRSRLRQGARSVSRTSRSMTRKFSSGSNNEDDDVWITGYSQKEIDDKLNSILEYIMILIPKEKSIKITIEIVINKTLKTMIDATNIYNPDFIVSSTLKSRRTDTLVKWKSPLINDKLATAFPVPVFLVPVRRMAEFELNLQAEHKKICKKLIKEKESKIETKVGVQSNTTSNGKVNKDNDNFEFFSAQSSFTGSSIHSAASTSSSLNIIPSEHKKLTNLTVDFLKNKTQEKKSKDKFDDSLLDYRLSKTDSLTTDICTSSDRNNVSNNFDDYDEEEGLSEDSGDDESMVSDEQTDLRSYRSVISTTKEKLHTFATVHRMIMVKNLNAIRLNDEISMSEKKLKKIDLIMNTSLEFVMDLDKFSDEEVDEEGEEFMELKTVLTGGAVRPTAAGRKSMLDVLPSKNSSKNTGSHKFSRAEADSTTIRFASNVKEKDGFDALGNSRRSISLSRSLDTTPSLSPSSSQEIRIGDLSLNDDGSTTHLNFPHRPEAMRAFTEIEKRKKNKKTNELRKVKSATQIERLSESSNSKKKKKKKKKKFFFF